MMPPLQTTTTTAGLTLAWREAGEGPALVFLHGIGSGSEGWEGQFSHFAGTHRVVAWDAPGYGGSGDLEPLSPAAADYADALAGLLDRIGIENAVLVGNSLGALMASAFVKRHAARVRGLVLSDIAAGHGRLSEEERGEKLMQRLDDVAELGPAGMAEKRAGRLIGPQAAPGSRHKVVRIMSKIRPKGYAQAARMLSLGDVFAELAGCHAPALVVCGAEDVITPPAGNRAVAEALGARFELIEGIGHLPYLEAPERFNALVAAFLATLEARP